MSNASKMSKAAIGVRGLMETFDLDPLTSDWWDASFRGDCDCGHPPGAQHHVLCSVTPIYSDMCEEFGLPTIDMTFASDSCTCPSWGNPNWPHRHGCPMVEGN
jgi:hypothetical protein